MRTVLEKVPKEKAEKLIAKYRKEIDKLKKIRPSCTSDGSIAYSQAKDEIRRYEYEINLLYDGYEKKEYYICDDCDDQIKGPHWGISITKNGFYTNINLSFGNDLTLCQKCFNKKIKGWT